MKQNITMATREERKKNKGNRQKSRNKTAPKESILEEQDQAANNGKENKQHTEDTATESVDLSQEPLAANFVPPWHGIPIPRGWQLTAKGLYRQTKAKNGEIQTELIAGPIWIVAIAYGNHKDNWTALIEFQDIDGHSHKLPCGRNRFHERGNGLVSELAGLGLYVVPGKEQKLLQYLVDCKPATRLHAVDRLGWLENEKLIYARQDNSIGTLIENGKTISIIYKPERHVTIGQALSGSLDDWQINIAEKVYSENMLFFALCLSFAPPLLKPAQMDSFGFNLSGGTTKGKTTALQTAASVWGNGADPAAAPESSFIKRWNQTANALEGLAGEHMDGLLGLDELGTCPVKDFEYVVYTIFGGLGKGAMDVYRQLKPRRSWRIIGLSTGELTVPEKLEQSGRKAKGGTLVRFPDIPFQLSDKITAADIDTLKRACSLYHGVAGKKYLEYLVNEYADFSAFSKDIRERLDIATTILNESMSQKMGVEQVRCAKRFALALMGGGLAKAANILLCDSQRIQDAVTATFRAYLKASPGISDGERGMLAVRDFILRHQSGRLIQIAADNHYDRTIRINNQAGYIVLNGSGAIELFLLFPEAFKEACGELSKNAVATALAENNLLRIDRQDRYVYRYLVAGDEKQQTFYAIKADILYLDS